MRTPEEVAREYYPECLQVTEPEGSKFAGERFCQSHYVRWVGDLDMCPVQHVLWLTIRARDAEVRADERAKVRYVVFDSDWIDPPGDVIAVFATKAEAWAHIDGPGDGYGWSVVEVPAP